jgi:acetyltransferase-like isoleucine patch superfamily enzyme
MNFVKLNNKLTIIFKRLFHSRIKVDYQIADTACIESSDKISIGTASQIMNYCIIKTLDKPIVIGCNVQINPFTVIYGHCGVIIGDNVMIAPHCMIVTGNHDYKQTEIPMRFAGYFSRGPIIIEDDVWIGANCTIGDGVRIGKGAVVAANSFVNKDVHSFDIVGGVPAKKIGNRHQQFTKG